MDEGIGTNDPIDLRRDNREDAEAQVDAVTEVTAASVAFHNASLPPDMPEWLKDAIREKASQIVQSMRDDELRVIDARRREDDEQSDQISAGQMLAERREREWDQSQVKIGSVTMSGEEWDQAFEALSDPASRDRLIQKAMRNHGWSQPRAEKAADDALTLAQIAQKKKDGTITPEDMAKADDISRRNPDAAVMAKEAAQMKADRGYDANVQHSGATNALLSGDPSAATAEYQNVVRQTAVQSKGSEPFSSAPDVAAHFDAARNADVKAPAVEPVRPAPQLVATVDMSMTF